GDDGIPADFDSVRVNQLGCLRSATNDGHDSLPGLLAGDGGLDETEEARLNGEDCMKADSATPNDNLICYLHTAKQLNAINATATTRGEFLAKQQGDFYLAAEEAGGGMAGASGAAQDADAKAAGRETAAGSRSPGESCCSSPLELWRSTLREREATYMAES